MRALSNMAMKERYRELLAEVELAKTELAEVRTVLHLYTIFSISPGREDFARFDITELYGRYDYLSLAHFYYFQALVFFNIFLIPSIKYSYFADLTA